MNRKTRIAAVIAAAATLTALSACGSGRTDDDTDSGSGTNTEAQEAAGNTPITVGTTDVVVSIDPAASYDFGSSLIQTQVFQYLLNFPAGAKTPQPDAAKSCDFSKPSVYTCELKPDLKFANGNPLNAEAVKYSFDRILKINNPNGPASLLGNLKSVDTQGDLTVNFNLKRANDVTFEQVLTTSAGPIVDPETFPADKVLSDEEAVETNGFSGPYTITNWNDGENAAFAPYTDYNGAYGNAQAPVNLTFMKSSTELTTNLESGNIDVAWRSLSPTDVSSLKGTDGVNVYEGAGGELRYIVFNLKTMPGNTDAQKLAVRKAIAYSVDRAAIAKDVYQDTFTPAYSPVPSSFPGATEPFKTMYGTSPNKAKAQQALKSAGVSTPVTLNIQYSTDHYGNSSAQEYAQIKRQLEDTGLFKVDLQTTDWDTYSEERVNDAYPIYQLGWFPDFPDADNYLSPFFGPNNFLQSHYSDQKMNKLLATEQTQRDDAARDKTLAEIQTMVAEQIPTLPLLTGKQVAASTDDIAGVEDTLDPSYRFRFTSLSRN